MARDSDGTMHATTPASVPTTTAAGRATSTNASSGSGSGSGSSHGVRILPQQRSTGGTSSPAGLLLIDGVCLREALAQFFPSLVAPGGGSTSASADAPEDDLSILLPAVVGCLEAAFGVHFKKR